MRGTRIRTLTGYQPVESLSVGDVLPAVFGCPAPIREIRHFRYERQDRNEPWPTSAMPIRIRASAIEDNIPHADLYVSAPHPLYVDGVLVPAWNLVNGTSITRDDAQHLDAIEYFHIVLDQHDVIDAEGALCDTFWEAIDDVAPSVGRVRKFTAPSCRRSVLRSPATVDVATSSSHDFGVRSRPWSISVARWTVSVIE